MKIALEITPTTAAADISVTVLLNGTVVHESAADHTVYLTLQLDDAVQHTDQKLQIKLDGKNQQHTKVDVDGNIISDAAVEIKRFDIEDIGVLDVFCSGKKCYVHNFNGNSDSFEDEFYGYIGCNGTVTFDFYSPIYLWIGEQFP